MTRKIIYACVALTVVGLALAVAGLVHDTYFDFTPDSEVRQAVDVKVRLKHALEDLEQARENATEAQTRLEAAQAVYWKTHWEYQNQRD